MKNPHPNFNQKVFVKIEENLELLKHLGPQTSTRKYLKKNLHQKNTLPPPAPTPQPARRRSQNFTELLAMFSKKDAPTPSKNTPITGNRSDQQNLQYQGHTTTPSNEHDKNSQKRDQEEPSVLLENVSNEERAKSLLNQSDKRSARTLGQESFWLDRF